MNSYLAVTIIVGAIGIGFAGLIGTLAFSIPMSGEAHPRRAIACGVLTVLWLIFCIGTITGQERPDVHEWRGGSGPQTTCTYDVRDESQYNAATKTSNIAQVTYTVCRDAR